jgi:hypothetical protein
MRNEWANRRMGETAKARHDDRRSCYVGAASLLAMDSIVAASSVGAIGDGLRLWAGRLDFAPTELTLIIPWRSSKYYAPTEHF